MRSQLDISHPLREYIRLGLRLRQIMPSVILCDMIALPIYGKHSCYKQVILPEFATCSYLFCMSLWRCVIPNINYTSDLWKLRCNFVSAAASIVGCFFLKFQEITLHVGPIWTHLNAFTVRTALCLQFLRSMCRPWIRLADFILLNREVSVRRKVHRPIPNQLIQV